MIASVLTLTRGECQALKITDAYSLHRVVYSLFPAQEGATRDFLFADKGGDFHTRKILLLSRRHPEVPTVGQVESKEIPEGFLDHELYGFEVRLNPTKRDKSTGKTVAVRGKDALLTWFCQKVPSQYGFEVLHEVLKDGKPVPLLQVQEIGVQKFEKGGTVVTHGTAIFVGKLRVVDRSAFRKTFEDGMGRAKGFGFGLLQIVPLQK